MSVYGGDSWAREAQHRKRRIDDLLLDGTDGYGFSYKKLPSGKYACLVCPHNPVLDTPLMLSMHCKGSRHCAAESKAKEKELRRQDEINKRIALSGCSSSDAKRPKTGPSTPQHGSKSKPLIEQTRKAASEILSNTTPSSIRSGPNKNCDMKSYGPPSANAFSIHDHTKPVLAMEAVGNAFIPHHSDFRERQERELKFTSAGWKRDGNGRWYKDENVEFDSDEEDPNICLGSSAC